MTATQARRSLRILVAEDNRDQVLTLVLLLRDDGHDVRSVYVGDAVLDAARSFDPEVYLLDIGMPRMSGYDVARTLRQRYGRRPILIAVTAYANGPDKLMAEQSGFDRHIAKPYDALELLGLVNEIAEGPPRS